MALTSITKDFVVKAGALVEGTSFVTSSTGQTGTLQVNGGAAIAKNLWVGTTATVQGTLTAVGQSIFQGVTATLLTATTLTVNGNETVGGTLGVTGVATFSTGFVSNGNTLFTGAVNTFSGWLQVTGTNAFSVATGPSTMAGTLGVGGVVTLSSANTATTGGLGSLVINGNGGAYIGNNLVVMGTQASQITTASNAIYTAGGIGAAGGGLFGGPVTFRDTVTFNGTATYVLSTQTYYTDNLLEIHVPPGGVYSTWSVDDGKDIGFRFHYYGSGADQNAALILNDTSKYLEWYTTGAESTTSNFTSATYGTFKTGNIILTGVTNATTTGSGALQVAGGIGIGLDVYGGGVGNFGSLKARNLTTASGIVYNDASGNLFSSPVTWNAATGKLVGVITTATYADNLNGGTTGSLPYQSNAAATSMLPIGTNGFILSVVGGLPAWTSVSGLSAGFSTTATNIAGGNTNQIPFQNAPGQTTFNTNLQFNPTGSNGGSGLFSTTNILIVGTNNATTSTVTASNAVSNGALMVQGGVGIAKDLWVGGNINVAGNIIMDGVGLDTIQGTTATFVQVNVTGTGYALTVTNAVWVGTDLTVKGQTTLQSVTATLFTATTVTVNGLTTLKGVTSITDNTPTSSPTTGALVVTGGVGVGGGVFAGGSMTATFHTANGIIGGFLNAGAFNYGTMGYTDVNVLASFVSNTGTYNQMVVQNLNNGATASANLNISNNAATSSTNYGELGINSTGFTGSGGFNGPGNVYLAAASNDLAIGTYGANNIKFIVNSGATDVLTITSASVVAVVSNLPTSGSSNGALTVAGGVGITGGLVVGGIATATTLLVTGNATVKTDLTVNGQTTLQSVTATLFTATTLTVNGDATIKGVSYHNGQSVFQSVTATLMTVTTLTVNGNETIGGTLNVTGLTTLQSTTATLFTATNITANGTLWVGGVATFNNATAGTSNGQGAVVIPNGGAYVGGSLFVGQGSNGTVTVGNVTTSTPILAIYSNNSLYASYTSGNLFSNSLVNLDSYSSTAYRTAKYLVQIVDGTKVHVEEILVFHDGSTVYMTEYGIATSQGELGTFDATYGANIQLNFTPNYTPTSMVIKMVRQGITF